jgi:hypothetical protein
MSTRYFHILILFFGSIIGLQSKPHEDLMRAMRDEAKRALSELQVESLQKPYYVEYMLTMRNSESAKASLGGIINTRKGMSAVLTVGIRVGNPKFDNTNFFDVSLGFFGSGDDEESFRNRRIPIELDYASLRRELWLATDACYKQSSELHAKKEAAIKNRLRTDTTHDFIPQGPSIFQDAEEFAPFDLEKVQSLVKELSSSFLNHPTIASSTVSIENLPETILYVNTEGREFIKTKHMTGIEIIASGQCQDGMPIAETYTAYARSFGDLPGKDSLSKSTMNLIQSFEQAYASAKLEEAYSGPIMVEGQAANEIFAQIFAPQCIVQRPPLTDRGVQDNDRYTAFQNKIGGRVLPEYLSVTDNPGLQKHDGTSLVGHYAIDYEGTPAKSVNIRRPNPGRSGEEPDVPQNRPNSRSKSAALGERHGTPARAWIRSLLACHDSSVPHPSQASPRRQGWPSDLSPEAPLRFTQHRPAAQSGGKHQPRQRPDRPLTL